MRRQKSSHITHHTRGSEVRWYRLVEYVPRKLVSAAETTREKADTEWTITTCRMLPVEIRKPYDNWDWDWQLGAAANNMANPLSRTYLGLFQISNYQKLHKTVNVHACQDGSDSMIREGSPKLAEFRNILSDKIGRAFLWLLSWYLNIIFLSRIHVSVPKDIVSVEG